MILMINLAFVGSAFAQDSNLIEPLKRNLIRIDVTPLITSLLRDGHGLGLEYEHNVYKNFGFGLKGLYRVEEDSDTAFFDKFDIIHQHIGIYASYYLDQFGRGFFASVGIEYAKADVEATGTLVSGDQFIAKDDDDQTSVGVVVGYTFLTYLKIFNDTSVLNGTIGASYRPGHEVTTLEDVSGGFSILSIEHDFGINLSLGLQF